MKIFSLSHFSKEKLLKFELDENIWFESLLKGKKILLKSELDENICFESLLKETNS